MAKLTETATRFSLLPWSERVAFMTEYRERRQTDLASAAEFDLSKQAKSTKTREKKLKADGTESKPRKKKEEMVKLSHEQLSLLKQLGLAL